MKTQIFSLFVIGALSLIACQTDNKPNAAHLQAAQDSSAINNTVHGFFKWYNEYALTPDSAIDEFLTVNKKTKVVTLNAKGLESHIAKYINTGLVGIKWAEGERAHITASSKRWTTTGEQLEGLEADRCYCAQDGNFPEFATAPVKVVVNGNQARATMTFDKGSANGEQRKYELEKVNDKWLITTFDCGIPPTAPPMVGGNTISPMVVIVIDAQNNLLVNDQKVEIDKLEKKIRENCNAIKAKGITPQVVYKNESKTAGMGFRQEVQTVIQEAQK